jgi:hypothetical protein
VIELYAITDDPAPPQPPLLAVSCNGLTALCAPASEQLATTPDALWRREELVEALMADRDLLPVRFGTLVEDEEAAARAVADRHDELLASLDRVRGAVELALRVQDQEPSGPEGPSGRDYLQAKVGQLETARVVHEPLAELARDSVVASGPELLRAAYLVDREAVPDFVAAVKRLQDEHSRLALLCTGPWPPYSFAER